MESNVRVDFNYFNTAPVPYPYFGNGSETPSLPADQQFKHGQINNEHFDPTGVSYQQNFDYEQTPFLMQTQPSHIPPGPAVSHPRNMSMVSEPDHLLDPMSTQEFSSTDPTAMMRSSSEEKDNLTPQQNKRKAQNRAAQRAFRERKEKHVKELEARNTNLQYESVNLQKEVERLRKELAQANAQKNILQATSSGNINQSAYFLLHDQEDIDSISVVHGYVPSDNPPEYSPANSTENAGAQAPFGSSKKPPSDTDEEMLLDSGRTWDYIQNSELYRRGLIDVGDVCERLKNLARCDGKGPVFSERDILSAIAESSVAGGRDELI